MFPCVRRKNSLTPKRDADNSEKKNPWARTTLVLPRCECVVSFRRSAPELFPSAICVCGWRFIRSPLYRPRRRIPYKSVILAKAWGQSGVASSRHSLKAMNTSHLSQFNRRKGLWAAGALVLAGVFAAGAQSVNSKAAVEVKRDAQPVNRGPLENGSFSSVVKRVAPSVVKITT